MYDPRDEELEDYPDPRRGDPMADTWCFGIFDATGEFVEVSKALCSVCPFLGENFDSLVDCKQSMFDHDTKGLEVIYEEA